MNDNLIKCTSHTRLCVVEISCKFIKTLEFQTIVSDGIFQLDNLITQIPTMDFEQSENSSQTSPVISVSPTADPLPGQPSTVVKSDEEPSETSPPRNNTLVDLQNVAKYIQDQIRELDSQLLALDTAYRTGKKLTQ